jgi:hypothetical protein
VKKLKEKMHPWRTQYRNFLWAVWSALPHARDIKHTKEYETIEGRKYSEVVKYLATQIYDFLFERPEFDMPKIRFPEYITIKGIDSSYF